MHVHLPSISIYIQTPTYMSISEGQITRFTKRLAIEIEENIVYHKKT